MESNVQTCILSSSLQLLDHLKVLDRHNQVKFVDSWLANTLPEDYVLNANILIEACLNGIYSIECSKIMDVFIKHISTWSVWPALDAWRNDVCIQRKIFVDHMEEILISYNDYYDKLTRIFIVQEDDVRAFFIEYLISNNNVSSEYIIVILKKLSIRFSAGYAEEALKWCISTEIPLIHPSSGDKPFSNSFSQIDEDLLPICKLLWRMLGHPDKKYRWIAAHIIRNLYSCGYQSIIGYFTTLYNDPFDLQYMDKNNSFFIESAKVYFLVVCLRIFGGEPKCGVPFYNFFKEIACSEQTIHALQRRLAKHVSLKIAEVSYPGDMEHLLISDELKLGKIKKTPRYARASFSSTQKFRFHFDYMDTLPHWYNEVADIFCLTQEEVAKDCDNYIQQFGIDNNKAQIWRNDYLHYNRYRNRNSHNSQGCMPEIETMEKYAEWHAMFYVADQYRCTLPYSEDTYKNFHEWLDSYLPGYRGYWSSEYRDQIPFIPFLWEFKKYMNPENDHEYMIRPGLINSLIVNEDSIVTNLIYNSSFDQSCQRDMLSLPVPKANYHNIAMQPTDLQKGMVADLSDRADKVRNKMVEPNVDNMLLITNDGRKLALDQRLMNDMLPDDENSKVSTCANNVFGVWEKTKAKSLTQLVFCDLSTPHYDDSFNVYDDIKNKLISKGVPENEVAFIHDAKSEVQKKEMFAKVRKGQIRVLLGSTFKMGAGTNCQDKLVALHDLDCPWRPSDLEQRSGRIIRQGNQNDEVDIFRYVTKDTFDSYLFQLVEKKQKFISQVMTSKSPARSAEDVDETALSYAEIKALATGNPYIREKMNLDNEVSRLKVLKSSHLSQKYALEDAILKHFPKDIKQHEERIEGYKADVELLSHTEKPTEDKFSPMVIDGITYLEKETAGKAIIESCKIMTAPEAIPIGTYRGFNMELLFDTFSKEYRMTLKNELSHTIALGSDTFGNITRIENAFDGFNSKLQACTELLENTRTQFETAKIEVEKPFSQEDELTEKSKRLDELNILLNMDQKENELVEGDAEIDEEVDTAKDTSQKKDYDIAR